MRIRKHLNDIGRAIEDAMTPRKPKRHDKEGRWAYTGEVSWMRAIVRGNDRKAKEDSETRRREDR